MINVAEGRTAQLLKEYFSRLGGEGAVARRRLLNGRVCTTCSHSAAWHPDVKIGLHREFHCLYPGCSCSRLRYQEKSVVVD